MHPSAIVSFRRPLQLLLLQQLLQLVHVMNACACQYTHVFCAVYLSLAELYT